MYEDAERERREENDDPELRERAQAMDDYKDGEFVLQNLFSQKYTIIMC